VRLIHAFSSEPIVSLPLVTQREHSRRFLGAIALLLFGISVPAFAQTSDSSQPKKLSLQEALDIATQQNLDLVAARLRQAISEAGVQIARQLPNPTVSFAAARDLPHESLLVDQPLELGGLRGRRVELARSEVPLTCIETTLERQFAAEYRSLFAP
jgi:hypothetical protein